MVNEMPHIKGNNADIHRVVVLLTTTELSVVDGVAKEMGFRSRAEAFRQLLRERRERRGAIQQAT